MKGKHDRQFRKQGLPACSWRNPVFFVEFHYEPIQSALAERVDSSTRNRSTAIFTLPWGIGVITLDADSGKHKQGPVRGCIVTTRQHRQYRGRAMDERVIALLERIIAQGQLTVKDLNEAQRLVNEFGSKENAYAIGKEEAA